MVPLRCPTPRGFALSSKGYRPRACRRLRCGYCGPRVTLGTVKALVLAMPHASGVLCLEPDSRGDEPRLGAFANALGRIARSLRSQGLAWEYAWVVELTPRGAAHVHFLQHGSPVSGSRFRAEAHRVGAYGDLQPIRHLARIARYVLKLPLAGLDLEPDRPEDLMALHLALNGGALLHASRHFWRDSSGEPLRGLTAAREAARSHEQRPRPRRPQLERWRRGWSLPPVPLGLAGSPVGPLGPANAARKGEELGAGTRRLVEPLGPTSAQAPGSGSGRGPQV